MEFLNHLNFKQISVANQQLFIQIADWYDSPVREELLEVVQAIDLANVRNDYLLLLDQIKNILQANNLLTNHPLLEAINQSLADGNYSKIPDYIEKVISLDSPDINSVLIPQLSQLCNVYATFERLNKTPGLDGKEINLFKLPMLN